MPEEEGSPPAQIVPPAVTLLADESGFTGRNIFDLTQPVHLEVGLWFSPRSGAAATERIEQHISSMPPDFGELSGTQLMRSAPGRRFLVSLVETLASADVKASVVAMHKPFMAAGVVVEDYTDYVDNPAFDASWTWPSERKERLAESILRFIPNATLNEWWTSRNRGTLDAFRAAHQKLVGTMKLVPALSDYAPRFASVRLADIHETEQDVELRYSPSLNGFDGGISIGDREGGVGLLQHHHRGGRQEGRLPAWCPSAKEEV